MCESVGPEPVEVCSAHSDLCCGHCDAHSHSGLSLRTAPRESAVASDTEHVPPFTLCSFKDEGKDGDQLKVNPVTCTFFSLPKKVLVADVHVVAIVVTLS